MKKVYFYFLFSCIILFSECKKTDIKPNPSGDLEVLNLGVPGNTASDLLARIKNVTDIQPNLVFIMIGSNDASTTNKIFDQYKSNLGKIIDKIQSNGAKVILLTPPPYLPSSSFYPNSEKLDMICSTITAVSKDKSCEMIDIHSYINSKLSQTNNTTLYNIDGLHPNRTGYLDIANYILAYLQGHPTNNGFKIVCFGDSITYGYEVDGQGTSTGDTYPADLERGINYALTTGHKFSENDQLIKLTISGNP